MGARQRPPLRRHPRVLTQNVRGVLGKVANAIAEQDCNIQNVSTDGEQGTYTSLNITVQVTHRLHSPGGPGCATSPRWSASPALKADQKAG